jgi:hypothetical protein
MKNETIINKSDLFDYLDWYVFVDDEEIQLAICDYIENQEGVLYYSDCAFAYDLMQEYKNYFYKKFNKLVEKL